MKELVHSSHENLSNLFSHPRVQGLLASAKNFIAWQPLTVRGVLCIVLSIVALQAFAIPESDLVAHVTGGGFLGVVVITVLISFLLRVRLGRSLEVEARFDRGDNLSQKDVPAGMVVSGANLPPFFVVSLSRQFAHPGPQGQSHLISGGQGEEGERRHLIDSILFPHRGLWPLEAIRVEMNDLLGLTCFRWDIPCESSVEVSAPEIPIRPLPVVAASSRSGDIHNESREKSGDLFDLKPYDPSDGIKRILWKTFARSGQLVVRRPEPAIIPEGEVAIYLVAGTDDDLTAGAFRSYLSELVKNQITVLFGTDGLKESGTDTVSGESSFIRDPVEILRSINRSVWSEAAGSGRGFADYIGGLRATSHVIHRVILFCPDKNAPVQASWLDEVSNVAQANSLALTIALVPQSLDFTLLKKPVEDLGSKLLARLSPLSPFSSQERTTHPPLGAVLSSSGVEVLVCEPAEVSG